MTTKLSRCTVWVLFWAGCSSSYHGALDTGTDTVAQDAGRDGALDGPNVEACGPRALAFSRSEEEVTALARAFIEDLKAAGSKAYVDHYPGGTAFSLYIRNVRFDFATSGDPALALLETLETLSPTTIVADEYRFGVQNMVDLSKIAVGDGTTIHLERYQIAGAPFEAGNTPALSATIKRTDSGWQILALQLRPLYALAQRVDATRMSACEWQGQVPTAAVFDTQFEGLAFEGCSVAGEYTYQARSSDMLTLDEKFFVWRRGEAEGKVVWQPVISATYEIHPDNFWDGIQNTDCYCDEKAGYDLELNALSGDVLKYYAGINCVVC